VPNGGAIRARIWAPGLDDGYVPQGIALAEGALLVSAYQSTQREVDRGPCRVFRVDLATGTVTGYFDLPPECGHAGGLAYAGRGLLYVADTHVLFAIDLPRALADGNVTAALRQQLRLDGGVTGSFCTFHGGKLWLGRYQAALPGALHGFAQETVAALPAGGTLTGNRAEQRLEIPARAQGAAFDAQGRLWLALSSTKFGKLVVLNPDTGQSLAEYDTVTAVEGLVFDGTGGLWAVTEAGSRRWLKSTPYFPLAFRLDPAALQ
jgi:sugar lactone lactonase YvrE